MSASAVIIFDLDGTITEPYIDFDAIRFEIGIASGTILEALQEMDAPARKRAEEIVLRHEWEAARNGAIYDDAAEVLSKCRDGGLRPALLTRNSRPVVDFILRRHSLGFDAIRTREDGAVKPSSVQVRSILDELRGDATHAWMVGDYLYDIVAGEGAGCHTVLMVGCGGVPEYGGRAEFVIRRLSELPPILGIR